MSNFARFAAVEDVAGVPGVVKIDDELIFSRPPSEIKADIEDRMYWDPMVDRERVTVAVGTDGVATLTGTSMRGARSGRRRKMPFAAGPRAS